MTTPTREALARSIVEAVLNAPDGEGMVANATAAVLALLPAPQADAGLLEGIVAQMQEHVESIRRLGTYHFPAHILEGWIAAIRAARAGGDGGGK